MSEIRQAAFGELDGAAVFGLARLRQSVFVVEQECAYPDLDGHDTDPETRHFWIEGGEGAVACLRLLRDSAVGGWRIGRVCCAPSERGTGLSGRLMAAALAAVGPGAEVVLDSQTYAAGFYRKHGFEIDGEEFVEDGIAHVPMRRAGR
ncbi:GNAT family N-acetyltransferase [Glycomyces paridis]|nr:GNAT family N-acetyltransferase [Glycomyces paridis]